MKNNVILVTNILREVTRFLRRDYFQLEDLQGCKGDNADFCQRSSKKLFDDLIFKLSKYFTNVIFHEDQLSVSDKRDVLVVVNMISGMQNFQRALPFFGFSISFAQMKSNKELNATDAFLYLPVMNELYIAEYMHGLLIEKYSSFATQRTDMRKSKVSQRKDLSGSVIFTEYKYLDLVKNLTDKIYIVCSAAYAVGMVVSGKADICIFDNDILSCPAYELLIFEAGGCSGIIKEMFIGSNYNLAGKVKEAISNNLDSR